MRCRYCQSYRIQFIVFSRVLTFSYQQHLVHQSGVLPRFKPAPCFLHVRSFKNIESVVVGTNLDILAVRAYAIGAP